MPTLNLFNINSKGSSTRPQTTTDDATSYVVPPNTLVLQVTPPNTLMLQIAHAPPHNALFTCSWESWVFTTLVTSVLDVCAPHVLYNTP